MNYTSSGGQGANDFLILFNRAKFRSGILSLTGGSRELSLFAGDEQDCPRILLLAAFGESERE